MATTPYRVIGTRPVRHDGVDKVTGRAVYGGDTRLSGLLYGHAPSPLWQPSEATFRERTQFLKISGSVLY